MYGFEIARPCGSSLGRHRRPESAPPAHRLRAHHGAPIHGDIDVFTTAKPSAAVEGAVPGLAVDDAPTSVSNRKITEGMFSGATICDSNRASCVAVGSTELFPPPLQKRYDSCKRKWVGVRISCLAETPRCSEGSSIVAVSFRAFPAVHLPAPDNGSITLLGFPHQNRSFCSARAWWRRWSARGPMGIG